MEELAPGAAKMMVVLHRWMGSVSVGGAQHPIVVATDGNGTGQLVLSRDISVVQSKDSVRKRTGERCEG